MSSLLSSRSSGSTTFQIEQPPKIATIVTKAPDSKMPSSAPEVASVSISTPTLVPTPFPIPDMIVNPHQTLIGTDTSDKHLLNWAFQQIMVDNEIYTTQAGMSQEVANEKTRPKVNNLICILKRLNEVRFDRDNLKHNLAQSKKELDHEIKAFEEELAVRDHQILEQEQEMINIKEKLRQMESSLWMEKETRKNCERALSEAEDMLMDAAVELRVNRLSSKRSREDSNEDVPVLAKRTKKANA